MKPTRHVCRRKLAHWLSLLTIIVLLLPGLALPAAQAAPDAPQAATVIAALSDYGSGETIEQTVANMIASWNPAWIVTAGDNYHYQNCSTYATCVGAYYGSYVSAQTFKPTMGNHDLDATVGLAAYNSYFSYLPTIPDPQRRWYDFVAGDVHFFMLDGNGNQSTQSTWLSTAVPASTSAWNIAVIHQAPYSTGNYGDIAASQLPYGTYGIDFVISGHNHHYERLVKADGGKIVRYFIDGYGGSLPSGLGHSYCAYNTSAATSEFCLADTPGAIKLTASDTSITFQYYDSSGAVRNTYTQVIGPEINTSVSTLAPFNTTPGAPSAAQIYTVSGSLLTEGILITAPSGFEIATVGGGPYGSSLTLPQSGGTVGTTTIYARLTGATGTYSGNIAHSSAGATTRNVAVNGTALNQTCTTVNLVATADTYMSGYNTTYNYGAQTYMRISLSTGSQPRGSLVRWDLSGIPADATVESASLTVNVSTAASATYYLYNMRRAWVEGSGTGSATGNGATWLTYDGSNNWGTSGAANTSSDRYDTNLWGAGSSTFSTTGIKTVDLNTAGEAAVQGWIASPASNYGVTIQNYVTSGTTDLQLSTRNHATSDNRPKLNVTYCVGAAGPTITTSTSSLAAFSTPPGTPSAPQPYTVSGSNLTADISIAAPAGFEISTDGTNYYSSRTLTQSGGTVETTTIYARLTGAAGAYDGNIAHTSAGATTKNVAVNGTASNCTTVSFQQGTAGYAGARDTHIQQYYPTYNYGAATPLLVDSDEPSAQTDQDVSTLLYWDISAIPAGSTIDSASVAVYVENVTDATPGFDMYAMTQAWAEGTGSGSATGDGATWNTYDGIATWPGGAGGSSDRGTTALANFAPTATGSYQVSLNSTGLAVLEGWISTPAGNKGFMIHAGTEDNGLDFTSREGTTVANRPKLTIGYCLPPTTPYIVTSGTLNAFSSLRNVPSAVQSYTVSGGNLTGAIVITAPADFQISLASNSGFGTTLNLTPNGEGIVSATTVYVRFLRPTLGTSSGNITHESTDAATRNVAVSGTAVNGAPGVTLVQPADDATGIATSPALEVTVTDPDSDTMSVSFYGRVAGEGTGEQFTLVVIPDTQNMSASSTYAAVFNSMTQWIAGNKTSQNIAFATHVGDIVNTASNTTEWGRADTAMDYLDAGNVSYSVGPGNHDLGTLYSTNFGSVRFSSSSWYQGYYTSGSDNYNNYSFFTAGGMDFIIINLQYGSTTEHQGWADQLLKDNPTKRGIVVQHNILNTNDSWNNQALYTGLSDNPNLFLMLCGHMHAPNDGAAYRAETRTGMQTVHILMVDYQDFANGGDGWMRILRFLPSTDTIDVSTYSPYRSEDRSTETAEDMDLAYDMVAGAPFELIGTVTGVAPGSTASIAWPGRNPSTEYEWYAVANDGAASTTSATWSFTTGISTAAVPKKPVVTSITQGSGHVGLTWDPVTLDVNNQATTILKYQVYGSSTNPYFTSVGTLLGEPTTPTFTHTNGSTGATNWYYLVRAVNAAGPSDYSVRRTGRFGFTLVPGTTTP